jgi:bacteriocin biosynthesis cyclodehydratase domain-containing protein
VDAPGLPTLPYLAPWYRLAEVDGGFALEHGHTVVRLDGAAARRLLPALLPLLDGTRTMDEIAAALGEPVRPAVEQALRLLAERKLLVEGPPGHESDPVELVARFVAPLAAGAAPSTLAGALRRARVSVRGSGALALEIGRTLQGAGVVVDSNAGTRPDLVVAAPSPHETDVLDTCNAESLERGFPWLQVLPFDGRFAAVGPLFLPGETCCRECYVLRRHANVPYPAEFAPLEAAPVAAATPAPLRSMIAGLTGLVVVRWLAARDPLLPGALLALEPAEALSLRRHLVHRVPRCPACSPAAEGGLPLPWFPEAGGARV